MPLLVARWMLKQVQHDGNLGRCYSSNQIATPTASAVGNPALDSSEQIST